MLNYTTLIEPIANDLGISRFDWKAEVNKFLRQNLYPYSQGRIEDHAITYCLGFCEDGKEDTRLDITLYCFSDKDKFAVSHAVIKRKNKRWKEECFKYNEYTISNLLN